MPSKNLPLLPMSVNFPVVGVGASAGGIDAFKRLVQCIQEDSGMAYVLVMHLAPDHESLLPEILARETKLPVHEITDDINLAPNHIYIIPENKILTVYDGKLKLSPRAKAGKANMPIDIFFNSLAEVHNGFARGVLLSGTGFDGTLGLKSIKECGGATFVQNPEAAMFDGMPLSAVRAGAADFILEVEEIPEQLHNIDIAYENSNAYTNEDITLVKKDDDFYKHILRLLRLNTGNDFSHYKQPTIRRRIARRMVITKKEDPDAYLNYIRSDKNEQNALFNDILIPVSYFFRDSKIFDILCETTFPLMLKRKTAEEGIRIWSAGCSTGEEAYSLAICLHEYFTEKIPDIKIQVFASDISENVIAKARAGIYSRQEVQNISETRLRTYFTKVEGSYLINKEIREMCIFAVHNFVKDPPFAKMDIISCRNVLIYLDPFLQKKAFTTFHYALRQQGVLFLGKSETVGQVNNLFEPMVKNHKIYLRKSTSEHFVPTPIERTDTTVTDKLPERRKKTTFEPDFQRQANELLFTKYTPAGVIINEHKDIVHFHGDTSPFLFQPPGKPNFNIYKMLREGLTFELRTALLKVKTTQEPIKRENLHLKDKNYLVTIEILPLENKSGENHLLILFYKVLQAIESKKGSTQRKTAQSERIKQLEAEIEQMRDDIRKVTEDQEVVVEELQSANEELLSNTEELQTLNEELETSAEELQSNNEELITVNDELMDRQEQLTAARLYSEAIIETIREPLVVLDRELRIKSANASFYRDFGMLEQEAEGKLLFDVWNGQWQNENIKNEIAKVAQEKVKLENYEVKINVPNLGERTMLLNIRPIVNDSVGEQLTLVAIEDITNIRNANILLNQSNRELQENNKELTSFSYITSHDLQEPLRKISTFSKLIVKDKTNVLSEESALYLDRITVSISRLQNLTDDLLNYSHISNTADSDFEDTDLNFLVNDVVRELKENIDIQKGSVTIADLPIIKTIPFMMRQLFVNLLSNALKYSKVDKRPRISVTFSVANDSEVRNIGGDLATRYYKIMVTDNGIGFPQEQASRIFEPFQRLHARDKYEGTGIGLAICKKIAFKHNGFITAKSNGKDGAVFTVYLPII